MSRLLTENCSHNLNCGLGLLTEHGSKIRPKNWTELPLYYCRLVVPFFFFFFLTIKLGWALPLMGLFVPVRLRKSQSQVLGDNQSERQIHGRDGGGVRGSPAKFCKQPRGKPLPKWRFSYCMVSYKKGSEWI